MNRHLRYSKWLDTFQRVHWTLRSSSNSCTVNHQFSFIAVHTHSIFSSVLLVEGLPAHGSLWMDSWSSVKHQHQNYIWVSFLESSLKDFLIIWIVFMDKCPSFYHKLMHIHYEYNSHTDQEAAPSSHNGCQHQMWNKVKRKWQWQKD